MKKNIFLIPLLLLFFPLVDVRAEENSAKKNCCVDEMSFYAKVFGGANFLQNVTINGNKSSYNAGYVFAGSLGYCWRYYGLRLEEEYAFRRNAIDKIHFVGQGTSHHGYFQTSSCMTNLFWDLPVCAWGCALWRIQPYIGAGIGCDFQKMHSTNSRVVFNQSWTRLSWQVMGGFSYPIFRNAELALEYKFHEGGSHFYNHSIGLAFVYKFGFIK